MVSRAQLSRFIRERINDANPGKPRDGLTDDISLLRSGILDSLALLELVAWIEREIGVPLELTEIDFLAEWDTITGILNYISKHQKQWL
jgi:acyl carrier protein